MEWKGSGDDDQLWRPSYGDGWAGQQLAIGRSSHGPALDLISNRIVTAWTRLPNGVGEFRGARSGDGRSLDFRLQ